MREIVLHRRAEKNLSRMPRHRQIQMLAALEEVADLANISEHPNIRALSGELAGWFRLRVGVYRAILQPRKVDPSEVLYVAYIGPRGDAY